MTEPLAPGQAQAQTQTQTQNTSLLVSIQSSSDPGLERRIFGQVASAGRQINRMASVLEVLIAAFERDGGSNANPIASEAIAAFRAMQDEIAQEKASRAPERIIEALEALRREDPDACGRLRSHLRAWLDGASNALPIATPD